MHCIYLIWMIRKDIIWFIDLQKNFFSVCCVHIVKSTIKKIFQFCILLVICGLVTIYSYRVGHRWLLILYSNFTTTLKKALFAWRIFLANISMPLAALFLHPEGASQTFSLFPVLFQKASLQSSLHYFPFRTQSRASGRHCLHTGESSHLLYSSDKQIKKISGSS